MATATAEKPKKMTKAERRQAEREKNRERRAARKRAAAQAAQVEAAAEKPKAEKKAVEPPKGPELLSTGSTTLNLAISGRATGAIVKGSLVLWVGDSGASKTLFALTQLAEAANNPHFDGYRLIYDPTTEGGNLMDIPGMFGSKLAARLEPPAREKDGEPRPSTRIEEFYYNVDDAVKAGKPFVYVCDSMDGLTSEAEEEHFSKGKAAFRRGKAAPGSYGDGKAKKNSENLRQLRAKLERTRSILIVICHAKELMNAMPFQDSKTRAGGRSLRYYCNTEIWTSVGAKIKREVNGRSRTIGNEIILKVKKNRVTGRLFDTKTTVYPSLGVDDLGSCVDFLVEEDHWKKHLGKIAAVGIAPEPLGREALIARIGASSKLRRALRKEVTRCWRGIEAACAVERSPRYV